jgi:DNA-binding NarL/FixJ family response regulator
MTIKVLLAEDHALVSQGIEMMLSGPDDIELVGSVQTAEAVLERVPGADIDVVLMDVKLAGELSGIEATRILKNGATPVKVLVLTMFTDPGTIAQAVKAGADGYLSKDSSKESVVSAIKDVNEGRSVLDPQVTKGLFGRITDKDPGALTDREMEVLQSLSDGKTTREVAAELFVSEETIKSHLKQIFRKLDVRDRVEAVAEAFRRGMVH